MAEPVDYKEFAQALIALNGQQVQAIDSMRVLILKTADDLRQDMKSQHSSLRHSLEEQNKNFYSTVDRVHKKQEEHEIDDEKVEKRVIVLEEGQKRNIWLVIVLVPSLILLWERLSAFIFNKPSL